MVGGGGGGRATTNTVHVSGHISVVSGWGVTNTVHLSGHISVVSVNLPTKNISSGKVIVLCCIILPKEPAPMPYKRGCVLHLPIKRRLERIEITPEVSQDSRGRYTTKLL